MSHEGLLSRKRQESLEAGVAMLESVEQAPRDAILGLTVAFNEDARSEKVNLSVGIYQDENGKTPTLAAVREAEQRLAAGPSPKTYLPIPGAAPYLQATQQLAFGAASDLPKSGRVAGAHSRWHGWVASGR